MYRLSMVMIIDCVAIFMLCLLYEAVEYSKNMTESFPSFLISHYDSFMCSNVKKKYSMQLLAFCSLDSESRYKSECC